MLRENAAPRWVGAAVVVAAWGVAGCSSSGAAPADAAVTLPPLGIAAPDCEPDACPSPATCSGTLLGPNTPVAFCTVVCSSSSACPSDTVCMLGEGIGRCLKVCTSDSDCSGGFACIQDGGYCWSPYKGADAVPEAS